MEHNAWNPEAGLERMESAAPALAHFTRTVLLEQVWQDTHLPDRDKALVTAATAIARLQQGQMRPIFTMTLEAGVSAAELSEVVTHLAFYCGWPNAQAAVEILAELFAARGVDAACLPGASPELLPLNDEAEEKRAAQVQALFGETAQTVVDNTASLLFRNVWLRPALAPRDRSLVTVAALVASGQTGQIPYHLNRAMDHGLTQPQAAAVLAHLAFYSGWPTVFSALPVFKDVFGSRVAG